jgi:hypothetical protein
MVESVQRKVIFENECFGTGLEYPNAGQNYCPISGPVTFDFQIGREHEHGPDQDQNATMPHVAF